MIRLNIIAQFLCAEAATDSWWDRLNHKEQQVYVKAHPKSKYRGRVKSDSLPRLQKRPVEKLVDELDAEPRVNPTAHLTRFVKFHKNVPQLFQTSVSKAVKLIPSKILEHAINYGIIIETVENLTDLAPELKSIQPQGWTSGSSWDDVGACFYNKKVIITPRKYYNMGMIVMHELGHAIDSMLGMSSNMELFKKSYAADVIDFVNRGGNIHDPYFAYFLQPDEAGRSEMFAEQWAEKLNGASGPLRENFPRLSRHMDAVYEYMMNNYVSSNQGDE